MLRTQDGWPSAAKLSRSALLVLCTLGLVACSSSSGSDTAPTAAPSPGACPSVGATTCDGLRVRRCEGAGASPAWSDARACDDESQICKDGGCRDLTSSEASAVAGLDAVLGEAATVSAASAKVDFDSLKKDLRTALLMGDGSPRAYVRTLWDAMLAVPQGHQMLTLTEAAPPRTWDEVGLTQGPLSRYGACLRPYQDHAVVTLSDGATTPLRRGDEILAIDGARGDAFARAILDRPFGLDLVPPTSTGRVAFGVRSFFSVDRKGVVLRVRHAGESSEVDVTLPAPLPADSGFGCDDAFGRDYTKPAVAKILADGTGVLYVPSFSQTKLEAFEAGVGPVWDKVKDTPRLVIDLRGNGGGLLSSALDLVSQIPGAKKTPYCQFFERSGGTATSPSFTAGRVYSVDRDQVPAPPRFAYSGKVAILIDGATHSAAEHLAYAAKLATRAIVVGTKTAGAYGTTTKNTPKEIPGPVPVTVLFNSSEVRTPEGEVLERTSVDPTIEVGYEPEAIAAGKDPMLERAVAELGKL